MKKKMILLPLCVLSITSVLMNNNVSEASTEEYEPYKYFDSTRGYHNDVPQYDSDEVIYGYITHGPPIVTMEQSGTVKYSNDITQSHRGYTYQSGIIEDEKGNLGGLFITVGPSYRTMEQGSTIEDIDSNEMQYEEPHVTKNRTPREERIAKREMVKEAEEIIEQYRLTSDAHLRVKAIEKVKLLDEGQRNRLNPKIERVYNSDYRK